MPFLAFSAIFRNRSKICQKSVKNRLKNEVEKIDEFRNRPGSQNPVSFISPDRPNRLPTGNLPTEKQLKTGIGEENQPAENLHTGRGAKKVKCRKGEVLRGEVLGLQTGSERLPNRSPTGQALGASGPERIFTVVESKN